MSASLQNSSVERDGQEAHFTSQVIIHGEAREEKECYYQLSFQQSAKVQFKVLKL